MQQTVQTQNYTTTVNIPLDKLTSKCQHLKYDNTNTSRNQPKVTTANYRIQPTCMSMPNQCCQSQCINPNPKTTANNNTNNLKLIEQLQKLYEQDMNEFQTKLQNQTAINNTLQSKLNIQQNQSNQLHTKISHLTSDLNKQRIKTNNYIEQLKCVKQQYAILLKNKIIQFQNNQLAVIRRQHENRVLEIEYKNRGEIELLGNKNKGIVQLMKQEQQAQYRQLHRQKQHELALYQEKSRIIEKQYKQGQIKQQRDHQLSIQSIENQLQQLRKQNKQLQNSNKQLQNTNKQLHNDKQQLLSMTNQYKQYYTLLIQQKQRNQQLHHLINQNQIKQQQSQHNISVTTEYKQQAQRLKNRQTQLKRNYSTTIIEKRNLQYQLDDLKKQMEFNTNEYNQQIQEYAKEIEKKNVELGELRNANCSLKKVNNYQVKIQRVIDRTDEIRKLGDEIQQKKYEIMRLRESLGGLEARLRDREGVIGKVTGDVEMLRGKIRELEDYIQKKERSFQWIVEREIIRDLRVVDQDPQSANKKPLYKVHQIVQKYKQQDNYTHNNQNNNQNNHRGPSLTINQPTVDQMLYNGISYQQTNQQPIINMNNNDNNNDNIHHAAMMMGNIGVNSSSVQE